MGKLFHVVATTAKLIRNSDRRSALKGTVFITLISILVSLVLTSIGIMLVGERDWLSPLVLAVLLPLLLVAPPL